MKLLKPILLSVALLLPISIFLFLKFFGKNQFDVPMLYEQGVSEKPNACNIEYGVPYVLPDSVFSRLGSAVKPLYLVNFSQDITVARSRVLEEVSEDDVAFVDGNFSLEAKQCVFLLKKPYDLVLVDSEKRIRGYYVAANREEIDRLLIEISIILKKY